MREVTEARVRHLSLGPAGDGSGRIYVAPKPPHRPLITERGATHCTCGVFCASTRDLAQWRAHALDRFLLDPTTRLNPKPIGSAWWTIGESFRSIAEQHARAARHIAKTFEGMKLS